MVTAKQIFDMAVHLMDEQNETNGETRTIDTDEYRYRTISILNTVIPQLSPYSKKVEQGNQIRELFLRQGKDYKEPDLEQAIPLDDNLCIGLLPLYLAGQLQSTENPELARWYMDRYNQVLFDIRDKQQKGTFEKITLPYGTF